MKGLFMRRLFFPFSFLWITLLYTGLTQTITVTFNNQTNKDITLTFEYRLDQFFTRNEHKQQAFIPHTSHYHFFETIHAKHMVHIPLKFTQKCTREHCYLEENLYNSEYKRAHKRVHGLISLNQGKQVYEFTQSANTGQKIICTLSQDGLKVTVQ